MNPYKIITTKTFILGFAEFIFIVVMCYLFTIALKQDTQFAKIEIASVFETLGELPDGAEDLIEQEIYQTVSQNTSSDFNLKTSGATIDTENLINTYIESLDIHYLNFTINLAELQQSYRVVYEWSANATNTNIQPNDSLYVLCLPDNIFGCQDAHENRGDESIIYHLAMIYPFSGYGLNPYLTDAGLEFEIVLPNDTPETESAALAEVRQFVQNLGFNPDDYLYNASYSPGVTITPEYTY